jgi:hypothetical protein
VTKARFGWAFPARAAKVAPAQRRFPGSKRWRVSSVGTAAEVIGKIEPGVEITGLTNGQFSLVDILRHVLSEIGPAEVDISTWTMGIYDLAEAERFYRERRITRARWIIDPSIFSIRPELAGSLVKAFGPDAFRGVNCHAKFAVLRGERLQVAVRSSMNLNPNKRLENFDITEGPELAGYFTAVIDDIFERYEANASSYQSGRFFAGILERFEQIERTREGEALAEETKTRDEWGDLLGELGQIEADGF